MTLTNFEVELAISQYRYTNTKNGTHNFTVDRH